MKAKYNFEIVASGLVMGTYVAEDENQTLELYANDAGYKDYQTMIETLAEHSEKSIEEHSEEIGIRCIGALYFNCIDAIMVNKKDSFYEIPGAAEVESFEDLKPGIRTINSIEKLTGWGNWTHAINFITFENETYDYFLSDNPIEEIES